MTADQIAERADAEPAPSPDEARGEAARPRQAVAGAVSWWSEAVEQDHGLD